MFSLNQAATSIPASHFPFRIVNKGFKYLGVEITPAFLSLFTKNCNILFEKCKKDMARWMNLPLSLAGQINLIKMVVLPKFKIKKIILYFIGEKYIFLYLER